MKKKFSLWLNIITICMCFAALAVGVYAATSASLTISGQIGFEAHGVSVNITGTLSGYVSEAKIHTATETESKQVSASLTTAKTSDSIDLGDVYFTDLVQDENGNIPEIILTLNFENTSPFKVKATISASTKLSNNDITVTESATEIKMAATNGTGSVEIKFKLNSESAQNDITALDLGNKTIIVFEKSTGVDEGELYIDKTTKRLYVNYGTFPEGTLFGENAGKPIRWVAIKDLTENSTLNLANMTQVPTTGSFYFMSEFVFDSQTFNKDTAVRNGKNPNDYEESDVRAYLLGDDFKSTYNLTNFFNDIRIKARKLEPETITSKASGVTVDLAINNCVDKIWLLSGAETSYASAVMGTLKAYYPQAGVENIYNSEYINSNSSRFWFLRSPGSSYNYASYVVGMGNLHPQGLAVSGTSNLRPAFQLNLGV